MNLLGYKISILNPAGGDPTFSFIELGFTASLGVLVGLNFLGSFLANGPIRPPFFLIWVKDRAFVLKLFFASCCECNKHNSGKQNLFHGSLVYSKLQ